MDGTTVNGAGRYASVNGMRMYHELHGDGPPLVLLPGGLNTIEMSFASLLPPLAERHRVVALELQGHGRTDDIDRALTLENLADDVDDLLRQLSIACADFFGFSLGGMVALMVATRHPGRVHRQVIAGTSCRPDGFHAEVRPGTAVANSPRLPGPAYFARMRQAYERVAPDPGHLPAIGEKTSALVGSFRGWTAGDLETVAAPTLLIVGDTDFVRLDHAAEMLEHIPDCGLAVLPRTTHVELLTRTAWLLPMIEDFLTEPD